MYFPRAIPLLSLITALYLFAFSLVFWVLMPLQAHWAPDVATFAGFGGFVALTHGVRVIVTWLFRWRATLLLAPGAILETAILGDHYALSPGDLGLLVIAFTSSGFIAFEILRILGRDVYADGGRAVSWRWVMLGGALATLVTVAICSQLAFSAPAPVFPVWHAAAEVMGGAAGLLVWLLLLRATLRTLAKAL